MRIVFFATPDDALPIAEALRAAADIEFAALVTRPSKPKGRGLKIEPSALINWAEAHRIPVLAPSTLRSTETRAALKKIDAELFAVFAYGSMIPESILSLPPQGTVNIHPSLLPRYRGASPIAAALRAGDPETGISYMLLDEGMDTGPLLLQERLPILPSDDQITLRARLIAQAAKAFPDILRGYRSGVYAPVPQSNDGVSTTKSLRREDGLLTPQKPARELTRMVRAYAGWPGTTLQWEHRVLRILRAHAGENAADASVGTVVRAGNLPALATCDGLLILDEVQMPGKRPSDGASFLNGYPSFVGSIIT